MTYANSDRHRFGDLKLKARLTSCDARHGLRNNMFDSMEREISEVDTCRKLMTSWATALER